MPKQPCDWSERHFFSIDARRGVFFSIRRSARGSGLCRLRTRRCMSTWIETKLKNLERKESLGIAKIIEPLVFLRVPSD